MDYLFTVSEGKLRKIRIIRETKTRWYVGDIVGISTGYILKKSKKYHTTIESALTAFQNELEEEIDEIKQRLDFIMFCEI